MGQQNPSETPKPNATTEPKSLLEGAGDPNAAKPAGEQTPPAPKPGDLLSDKKADGTAKTAEEVAADKTKHEAEKAKGDQPVTLEGIKAPDGIDLKSPLAKEFVDLLNNKDLPAADRPQKLVDLVGKLKQDYDDKAAQLWLDMNQQWQGEVIKHFGGEEKTEAALTRIGSLLNAYDTDLTEKFKANNPGETKVPTFGKGLRQAMTLTGAGNNPEMVKFLDWVSDQLGEGAPFSRGTPGGAKTNPADRLYDGKR